MSRHRSDFGGHVLRAGILAFLFGIALALTGVAQAQKTVLPGMQTTPPPKNVLPGNPTTPPPMNSPDYSIGRGTPNTESGRMGSQSGSSGGSGAVVPPPAGNARQQFQRCIELNTVRSGSIDAQGMYSCVQSWMPQANFSRFAQCWADPRAQAWTCFNRAYN
jgi:hypothetical protein